MQLNLEQIRVFSVATRLPKIQEMELKPFLTIFGTGMRAFTLDVTGSSLSWRFQTAIAVIRLCYR
jgi:hypothetical protein